jgi:RNase P/RNase MRP subunit p29
MRSPTNITRHEWIGLWVVVVDASNKDLTGIEGEIVDETKNSFTIKTSKGEKKVLKKKASFKVKLDAKEVIVNGNALVGRPEDRIKK